jgi:transcriptional pleiotropic regulator of transition state genes
MKSTGITRPVDALGRVVIPMEIRENLDIKPKDLLDISVEGDKIVLSKHQNKCVFCGGDDDLVIFEDKKVCKACLNKLSNLA